MPLLDELDSVLENNDAFLVKLPNHFKYYLMDVENKRAVYTLLSESRDIGRINEKSSQ